MNVPVGHAAHSTNPVALFVYDPAGHAVQAASVDEARCVPAAHSVQSVAPAELNSPAAHASHTVECGLAAYVPFVHLVHDVADPVNAGSLYDPALHATHTCAEPAETDPAAHDSQVMVPLPDANEPAAHPTH